MKIRSVSLTMVVTLVLMLLLTGCQPKTSQTSPSGKTSPSPSGIYVNVKPGTSGNPSSDANPSASPSPGSSARPSPSPKASDDSVWTIQIDQTIPKTVQGMTVNYSLVLVAQKSGGKDVNGTYKGTAYVGVNFDASQMNNAAMQVLGGFNVNAAAYDLTFDVVGYDQEKYSEYGLKDGEPPLAPLVTYQSMALLSPEMEGTGSFNVNITAPNASGGTSNSNSSSTSIPMKMTIDSGKVGVYIPSFQLTSDFEGTVTGTPLTGSSPDNTVQEASDHIKSIMDQAASAASGGGSDLSGLMNQFKPK